jgi:hypothetical protein
MLTTKFLKVRGSRTKQQDFAFSVNKVQSIVKMARVLKFGLMEAIIAEVLAKESSRDSEFISGLTGRGMLVSGSRTRCLAREHLTGPTDVTSRESSRTV